MNCLTAITASTIRLTIPKIRAIVYMFFLLAATCYNINEIMVVLECTRFFAGQVKIVKCAIL